MLERWVSGLVILMGFLSAWVGMVMVSGRLRAAGRVYRKTETLCETMPDGWASWFLGGFSGLTMGARWMGAIIALAAWMAAGLGLIGLGLRLFRHT